MIYPWLRNLANEYLKSVFLSPVLQTLVLTLNNDGEVICNKDTAAASVLWRKLDEWRRRKYGSFISYPTRNLLVIYDPFTWTCICTESFNQPMIEMQNVDKWTERKRNSGTLWDLIRRKRGKDQKIKWANIHSDFSKRKPSLRIRFNL